MYSRRVDGGEMAQPVGGFLTDPAIVGYDRYVAVAMDSGGGQRGDIAQLGERGVRNAEVAGSSPAISTIFIAGPCSSVDRAAAS